MSDKSADTLVECERCGSTEFCLTREFDHSFVWIVCRQCDIVYGLAKKFIDEGVQHGV